MFTVEEEIWLQYLGFMQASSPMSISIEGIEHFRIDVDKTASFFSDSIEASLVLGKRAEKFLSHYLKNHPDFEILAENLQIIDDHETVGEIDFLIKNSRNQCIHLELACKFYLFDSTAKPEERWTGPNKRDFLALKLSKLQNRQFPLLKSKSALPYLDELGIKPSECKQQVLFQNFIFLPRLIEEEIDGIDSNNCTGFWIKSGELFNSAFQRELFYVPKKTNWLIDPVYNREWHSFESLKPNILDELSKNNSPMIWVLNPDGSVERWFVVWW